MHGMINILITNFCTNTYRAFMYETLTGIHIHFFFNLRKAPQLASIMHWQIYKKLYHKMMLIYIYYTLPFFPSIHIFIISTLCAKDYVFCFECYFVFRFFLLVMYFRLSSTCLIVFECNSYFKPHDGSRHAVSQYVHWECSLSHIDCIQF